MPYRSRCRSLLLVNWSLLLRNRSLRSTSRHVAESVPKVLNCLPPLPSGYSRIESLRIEILLATQDLDVPLCVDDNGVFVLLPQRNLKESGGIRDACTLLKLDLSISIFHNPRTLRLHPIDYYLVSNLNLFFSRHDNILNRSGHVLPSSPGINAIYEWAYHSKSFWQELDME